MTSAPLQQNRSRRVNAVLPGTIDTPMVTTMVAAGALDGTQSIEANPPRSARPTR